MQLKYSTALLLATIDAEQSAQAHQDHDRVQPHRHNNLREGHLQRRLGTFDSNGVGNDGTPPGLDNNPGHCKEGDPEFIVGGVTYTCEEEFNEMGGQCRTQDLTEEEKAQAREDFEKWKKEKSNNGNGTKRDGSRKLAEGCGDCVDWDNQVITIPTWFHVIHDGNKGKEFTYGENEHYINNQIKVMNDAFRGRGRNSTYSPYPGRSYDPYDEADIDTKIQFCLKGTTATDDKDWYNAKDQTNMKRQLDEGGMETLNVYAHTADGYLGWAYFPQTSDFDNDGVVIYNESFPGGGMAKYSEGDTCTHEVGHWLNLQHTHGNGCDGPGDYMDDAPESTNYDSVTANEKTASFYCPLDRDIVVLYL